MIAKTLLDYLSSRMLDSYSFLRDYQSPVFTFINNKRTEVGIEIIFSSQNWLFDFFK